MSVHHARLRLLLIYAIAVLPLVAWGASRALEANNNSPIDWVTAAFPARKAYDDHCAQFGPGDTVMVSWPGCSIHAASLDRLVEVLRTAKVFFEDGSWLFERVTSGREVAAMLTRPADRGGIQPVSLPDSVRRLQGYLIGPDGQTTAVLVTFNAHGLKQRKRLVDLIRRAAHEFCGVPDDQLHLAGPVIDGLSVDDASQATLSKYAGPSALVVLLLCWLSLRSLRAAAVVFALAMFCQGATLALVHYSGESMSALLIVLPPLLQVLAVAGGVHLTNYYFDLEADGTAGQRVAAAVREGWLPCTLSAGTTAIGMASLMASELEPIRAFGGYSAAGILLTAGVLLGLLPACYLFWPPRPTHSRRGSSKLSILAVRFDWTTWVNVLRKVSLFIAGGGVVMIVVSTWYAARITTSVRIETMFARDHRVIEDYEWLETNIGPLVPLEVTLSFDKTSLLTYRDKLSLLWRTGERLEAEDQLSSSFSAASCFPPLTNLAALSLDEQDRTIEQLVRLSLPKFEQLGLLTRDDGNEHWRLTTRTSALGTADYGETLSRVNEAVDLELECYTVAARQGLATNTTGIMPLVHAIQGQLLADLLQSFAAALVLIALVMTIVQGGILSGLLAMVPNVFPIVLFFGFLGWRGDPIDIGVVMTASVALGIAVDDTLHFLTFFRRELDRNGCRERAVEYAMKHCGPAMVQTSVSCGLGLLVFGLSDFLPTSRFATSMATLLALALAGDLVLLPALLLSPCGKLCASNTLPNSSDSSTKGLRQSDQFSAQNGAVAA